MKISGGLCPGSGPFGANFSVQKVFVFGTLAAQYRPSLQSDRKFFDEIDLTKSCTLPEAFIQITEGRGSSNI